MNQDSILNPIVTPRIKTERICEIPKDSDSLAFHVVILGTEQPAVRNVHNNSIEDHDGLTWVEILEKVLVFH